MHSIFGMKVIEVRPIPRMQLSEKVPVADDFRREINQWMISFFGMKSPLGKNEFVITGDTIFCDPKHVAKLRDVGKNSLVNDRPMF